MSARRSSAWTAAMCAALGIATASCDDASARALGEPAAAAAIASPAGEPNAAAEADVHAECALRLDRLAAELKRERELRLDREREWLRYTQRMARLMELAGAPSFRPDVPEVPAEQREARALAADPEPGGGAIVAADSDPVAAAPAPSSAAATDAGVESAASVDPSHARLERVARLASEERNRAVFLALRSLFTIEHISGLDLLDAGVVANGSTGPVVLRVLDERGRPLGSLYAERMRLEGSHAARTLSLILESGWERRSGAKIPFEGGTVDAEGRGGVRRIEFAHVDPSPWFEVLPELFREDQREAVTQGDPEQLTTLRFELNRRLRADASGPVYRLESLSAVHGHVLREVHLAVLTPELALERELFADHMSILRAEKGLEIVLDGGSQVRGNEKLPFLDGRYRIFLPRAHDKIWEQAGIPLGRRDVDAIPDEPVPGAAPPTEATGAGSTPAVPPPPATPGG